MEYTMNQASSEPTRFANTPSPIFIPAPHRTRVVTLAPERRGVLYSIARVIAWRIDPAGVERPEPILANGRQAVTFAFLFDAGETCEDATTSVLYNNPAAWATAVRKAEAA
jgi:hypothetical protein